MIARWRWRALLACALATTVAAAAVSCGQAPEPPRRPRPSIEPSWADVFEDVPDIYAVVRPRALSRDPLYGAFWRALVRAAEARGYARGATMIEAVEGADELVIGVDKGSAVLVLRGVSASIDPLKVADASGRSLFRLVSDERLRVGEYALEDGAADGALFVLPDRTWVGAIGAARLRARRVLASPMGRREIKTGDAVTIQADGGAALRPADSLVRVRFGGDMAHALDRHSVWGTFGRRLEHATFSLLPGKSGLLVALTQDDETAALRVEADAHTVLNVLVEREGKALAWLKDATVMRAGRVVYVRAPIPPRLLEELPSASAADFGL